MKKKWKKPMKKPNEKINELRKLKEKSVDE